MARGMSQQLRLWCLIFSGLCLQVLSLSPRRSGENCSDIPGWADSEGYTCAEYANKSWCTSEGRPGRGWSDPDSGLEDLWNDGYSAQAACCTCGGGQVSHINGMWQVLRGSCIVEGKCIMSPNYPENYSTDEGCVILVNNSLAQPLKTVSWDVEYWFDYLKINNRDFSGAYQPDAGLIPNGSIYWISDEDVTGKGWKLCANNSVPEALAVREPEVVTTSASPASASSLSSSSSSSSSRDTTDTTAAATSTTTTTTTTTTTVESTTTTTTTTVESTRTEKRSSSTEPRSEPPNDQCADVDGWEDSADFTCAEYVEEGWCTPSGRTGERWNPMWGEPSDYWYAGFSALEACCACGGGKIKEIPDLWMILSGPCSIVDGCIESPNYPSNYSNNQRCTILVNDALARPIEVVSFATEYGYDKLFINGRPFSGRRKPLKVLPHYSISWESDEDTTDKGWKLCPGQHFRGPGMFSPPEGPCTLDAEGCVLSPNYPDNYGPNQDCAIQVFNPENRSITVEKFSTEMLYDVMWVNGRMYAGKASPHGLVPREAIQWSTDEDTQDSGWKLCPGPVGQQVENIGGIDEEEGKDEDEYGYQGASGTSGTAAPRSTTEASGSQLGLEEDQNFSGNFIFKAALAAVALCLGGVLCLRFRRRSAGREEYGTRYGRSYVMDNL